MKSIKARSIFVGFIVVLALFLSYSSFVYFSLPSDIRNDPGVLQKHIPRGFPDSHVTFGLDLQGGVQLVLGVDTAGAIDNKLERYGTELSRWIEGKAYPFKTAYVKKGSAVLHVDFDAGADVKKFTDEYLKTAPGLIASRSDTTSVEFQFEEARLADTRNAALEQAERVIRSRVDKWGNTEPLINRRAGNSIMVQLPGFKDPGKAKELLGRTAQLKFKLVDDEFTGFNALQTPAGMTTERHGSGISFVSTDKQQILDLVKGKVPEGRELLFESESVAGGSKTQYKSIVVLAATELAGEDIAEAIAVTDQSSFDQRPGVSLRMTPAGATRFEEVTAKSVKKRLAIVLDDAVVSAPQINERIGGGNAMIHLGQGDFNKMMEEATQLSMILKSGAIPANIHILEERQVGASLGPELVRQGIFSALFGLALVFIFMILYYRRPGLIASIALLLNALFLLALMALFNSSLSLPGIAGFILTLGMAVDANVLINERIRYELRHGKAGKKALEIGFGKAFWTIFDSHVTTMTAAVILLQTTSSGPVRGFAITLLMGLGVSMFTSLYCAKLMFDFAVSRCKSEDEVRHWVGAGYKSLFAGRKTSFDFVGAAPKFFIVCLIGIASMAAVVSTRGMNWAVDFAGGTEVEIKLQKDIDSATLEQVAKKSEIDEIAIQALEGGRKNFLIRFENKRAKDNKDLANVADSRAQIFQQNIKSDLVDYQPQVLRVDYVGPQVGKELRNQGILSLLYALLGIVVYVALRFDFRFGPGSLIKLFIDLFAVAGFYIFFYRSFDLTAIAALLTIAGYGISDAVVVYDRIREMLAENKGFTDIKVLVNEAVNETLSRTILVSFATLLSLLGILTFGSGGIWNFAGSLVLGIVMATLSSIFIAAYGVVFMTRLQGKNTIKKVGLQTTKP